MNANDFVSAKDICHIIPMSPRHIQDRIVRRQDFPKPYRVGMRRYYKRTEVEAWWESKKK